MRRRLFDDPTDTGEPRHLLAGVPPPLRDRGCCSLAVAMQSALAALGCPQRYSRLMGQSGAGFMLRVEAGFALHLATADRERFFAEALAELGRQAQLLQWTPEAAVLCRQELDAGRPLVALGWGSSPEEWAVLTGWHGDDLVGYAFGSVHLERRPAAARAVLLPGPDAPGAGEGAAAPLAGLRRAVPLLAANAATYQAWLRLLEPEEPYGPPLGRLGRFQGEQWLSTCLVDARDAAAEYLAELLPTLPEPAQEAGELAADLAARLAERAEELLVPPDAVQRVHLPEDTDWRQQRRELLSELAGLESRLGGALRLALAEAGIEPGSAN